ncbi:MAG: zf-HC2 domain-containing protein [Oligoflexia bacterium]|nr:zf-HC2 domain-containing protein [Oligoflexia bacterium]
MPMSRCEDVIARISSILDHEANTVARLRFHAHLAMCQDCRRYYQQMVTVREAAGQVQPEDVPADFDHVMGFVLDQLDVKEPGESGESGESGEG